MIYKKRVHVPQEVRFAIAKDLEERFGEAGQIDMSSSILAEEYSKLHNTNITSGVIIGIMKMLKIKPYRKAAPVKIEETSDASVDLQNENAVRDAIRNVVEDTLQRLKAEFDSVKKRLDKSIADLSALKESFNEYKIKSITMDDTLSERVLSIDRKHNILSGEVWQITAGKRGVAFNVQENQTESSGKSN